MNKFLFLLLFLAVKTTFAQQPIFKTIFDNDTTQLRELLQKDNSLINEKNRRGNTPLHIAAFFGKLECAKTLIESGAKVDAKNPSGVEPIHFAFLANRKTIIKYLVTKGKIINTLDNQNNSLLFLAVLNNDLELVKFLVKKGADINHKNKRGNAALDIAQREGFDDISNFLSEKGAKSNKQKTELRGACLGQSPPGLAPELFAQNIVSTEVGQLNAVFSPDGKEFHFSERFGMKPTVMKYMKLENGVWTKPKTVPFSGEYDDVDQWISRDGNKIYFCSDRPHKAEKKQDHDFWVSKKIEGKWSEPELFDTIVFSERDDYYPTFTKKGKLYFSSQREGKGTNNIYCSEFKNGKYSKPYKLNDNINTDFREFDPFISPNDDYLIFTSEREGGFGSADLYISFKKPDGSWGKAHNMGENINTKGIDFTPMLSPDGKYLFFTRGDGIDTDIYWVDAKIIEIIRDKLVN